MVNLIDSGEHREFQTGAVRDIADGKGRCDLLPLDVIGMEFFDGDYILCCIYCFITTGEQDCIIKAIRHFISIKMNDGNDNDSQISAILELSKHYEDGCKKYGERNWEKGIPLHCFIDSGVRHYLKCMRGDIDERHDRAFLWNMFGLLWTIMHHPELNDLPYKEGETKNEEQ